MAAGPVVRLPGDPLTVNLWPATREDGPRPAVADAAVPTLSTLGVN